MKTAVELNAETPVGNALRLLEAQKEALKRLGISTVGDLLYHFPARYGTTAGVRSVASLQKGETAVVFASMSGLKTSKAWKKKVTMSEATATDNSGSIKVIWFHQPYIAKMIKEGSVVRLEGKVSERKGELYLANPETEPAPGKLPSAVGESLFGEGSSRAFFYPVYPETRGLSSRWLYFAIQKLFKAGILDRLEDPVPQDMLARYNLPTLKTALVWIHSPQKEKDAEAARKRFAFEEVFFIQLEKRKERMEWAANPAWSIDKTSEDLQPFISRFPFKPTDAQFKAIDDILTDFRRGVPMARLLEGDVGSGKTAVAAAAAYAAITTRPAGREAGALQVAYMAPTEILATQHFESFIKFFEYSGISIGLITGSGCRKFPSKVNPRGWTEISRSQLLKWVANGEIPVLVGTHALIQKTVRFKHLAFAVIDEQHRFGTAQRSKLVRKGEMAPHLLSMTATPIPRTLALTIFGDLDLTLLDQMPVGRKPVITKIVLPNEREAVYEEVRRELSEGRQAYVICPRISEPDPEKEQAVQAKSVNEEAKRLKRSVFQDFEIGVLHGKMKPDDKDKAMMEFKNGKTDVLVATSVVEVGVNVPNATVIIIEGAERFGLSQLHQLRGRVQRSDRQAYCFVFAEARGGKTIDRLKALTTAKNGFELAEHDLALRGAGELYGAKQWGISDVGMEAVKNIKMVEAARLEARQMTENDPNLESFPALKRELDSRKGAIHFE